MYYSAQIIEDVRKANNIVDVVSTRVHLVKKGANYFGLCPFHNEKTPSFSVNPDRQIYYCFSCNKGGDVLKFVMETERLSFPDTIQRLADRANMTLPESSDQTYNKNLTAAKERKARHLTMHEEAAEFFAQTLMSGVGVAAREYLQKRMVRIDTINQFKIGYAGRNWDDLNKHLRLKGYKDEEQYENGLVLKNKNAGFYDRFRDRIIFPIQDPNGRVIAFGGRTLGSDSVKYMNSPETPYYNKGKNLYGINFAKNTKDKCMIIVEGYMDLISLAANGIDNVVAPLGTALTESQVQLLKRYTDDAIVAFDSDSAGQAAALRSLDLFEKQGFRVRVLSVPEGKDPDDYIKANGSDAFRKLITEAVPLMDYRIESIRRKFPQNSAESEVRFLKEAVRALARLNDVVEREIYTSKIASQYNISEYAIKTEVAKYFSGGGGDKPVKNINGDTARASRAGSLEKTEPFKKEDKNENSGKNGTRVNNSSNELFVVALLAADNSLWDIVADKLKLDYIENQNVKQALSYACMRASQGKSVSAGELMWYFTSDESDMFAEIVTNSCHCEDNRRAMEQKIKEIILTRNRRNVIHISKALETGGLSEEDAARLREQLSSYAKKA